MTSVFWMPLSEQLGAKTLKNIQFSIDLSIPLYPESRIWHIYAHSLYNISLTIFRVAHMSIETIIEPQQQK